MTDKIKIEKGIPLPDLSRKYPFDKMKVGDSFFTEKAHLTGSVICAQNRTGFKFKSKFMDGGTRVWRIE
jgi:hypothetical protein